MKASSNADIFRSRIDLSAGFVIKSLKGFRLFTLFVLLILSLSLLTSTIVLADSGKKNKTEPSVILKKEDPFPAFRPLGKQKEAVSSQNEDKSNLPGKVGYKFLPSQDSAYFFALQVSIPTSVRMRNDLKLFADEWNIMNIIAASTPWQAAMQNLALPSNFFLASDIERVHRHMMIAESFYIPGMITYNPNPVVSIQTVLQAIGLAEDLSPNLSFDLNYADEVEIVIYSVQAKVIATVFKGKRPPGRHKFRWNVRDDHGRLQPSGDYIAEIRIGKTRFVRKRIYIP